MDGEEGGDQIRWGEGVVFDGEKGSLTSEKIEGVRMEGSREGRGWTDKGGWVGWWGDGWTLG